MRYAVSDITGFSALRVWEQIQSGIWKILFNVRMINWPQMFEWETLGWVICLRTGDATCCEIRSPCISDGCGSYRNQLLCLVLQLALKPTRFRCWANANKGWKGRFWKINFAITRNWIWEGWSLSALVSGKSG